METQVFPGGSILYPVIWVNYEVLEKSTLQQRVLAKGRVRLPGLVMDKSIQQEVQLNVNFRKNNY